MSKKREVSNEGNLKLSKKVLQSFYLVIPVSLLIVAYDYLIAHGEVRRSLPASPENLFTFLVFFNLPHIVASSVTFLDRDYLNHYRKSLLGPFLLIISGVLLLPYLIGEEAFAAAFALWTMSHVIGQQFGITLMMTGWKGKSYHAWKWLGLVVGACIYFGIYMPQIGEVSIRGGVEKVSFLLMIPFFVLTLMVQSKSKTSEGKQYSWSNFAMIGSAWLLFKFGYSFFVILIPRVIHDLTAFAFYMVHDQNRNQSQVRNFLYRALSYSKLPALVLCPIAAIGLAFPLTYFQNLSWIYTLSLIISSFHYYTDSFTWKQSGLHRKFIQVI